MLGTENFINQQFILEQVNLINTRFSGQLKVLIQFRDDALRSINDKLRAKVDQLMIKDMQFTKLGRNDEDNQLDEQPLQKMKVGNFFSSLSVDDNDTNSNNSMNTASKVKTQQMTIAKNNDQQPLAKISEKGSAFE